MHFLLADAAIIAVDVAARFLFLIVCFCFCGLFAFGIVVFNRICGEEWCCVLASVDGGC